MNKGFRVLFAAGLFLVAACCIGAPPIAGLLVGGALGIASLSNEERVDMAGMNTYSLFIPFNLLTAGWTSGVGASGEKLMRTIGYLMMMRKTAPPGMKSGEGSSSRTEYGEMTQLAGPAAASADIPGIYLHVDTDFRLPSDLDAVQGVPLAIGTIAADRPVAYLILVAVDQQKTQQLDNIDQPYPMAGDLVVYMNTASLGTQTKSQVILVPKAPTTGQQMIFMGVNNADAVDGVYQSPYSTCLGVAFFGPQRDSVALPGQRLAASPRSVGGALGTTLLPSSRY